MPCNSFIHPSSPSVVSCLRCCVYGELLHAAGSARRVKILQTVGACIAFALASAFQCCPLKCATSIANHTSACWKRGCTKTVPLNSERHREVLLPSAGTLNRRLRPCTGHTTGVTVFASVCQSTKTVPRRRKAHAWHGKQRPLTFTLFLAAALAPVCTCSAVLPVSERHADGLVRFRVFLLSDHGPPHVRASARAYA